MYKNLDLNSLSIDDIVEEYKILHERHQQLKESNEQDAQRIYELKRSLDTSLAAEKYLTQELEHLSAQAQVACHTADPRMQHELEDLRRKHRNLQLEHETLQQDYDAKCEETCSLKGKLNSAARELQANAELKGNNVHDESFNRLNLLEQENSELLQKLDEFADAKVQNTLIIAEREKTIEILRDQVSCLEENLRSKRDELEEKVQLLESSQEQLVEVNAKLALLTNAPEQNDRKGNSLFAEVDDQRQAMKHLLASQKKSYLDMKKIFNESKFEIHRLKRENIAMHTELQACSTIFCSADKTYQNKLNDRIRQLLLQNAKLESNLNLTQERLRELASQKSVTWLDSMLDFCKRETDELKSQLHSVHIQKATLEEQMRNMQQQMVRWRFESLKTRCVLIDRENILTEHKIAFKAIQVMEFDIKDAQLQAAKPRIVPVTSTSTPNSDSPSVIAPSNSIVLDTPLKIPAEPANIQTEIIILDTPAKVEQRDEDNSIVPESDSLKVKCELHAIKPEPEENRAVGHVNMETEKEQFQCKMEPLDDDPVEQLALPSKPVKKGTPIKVPLGLINVKSDKQLLSAQNEPGEEETAEEYVAAKPQRKGTPIKLSQMKAQYNEDDELIITPAKPQRKGTPIKVKPQMIEIAASAEAKPLRKGTPVRSKLDTASAPPMQEIGNSQVRSILIKRRELFAEDSQKNVHFSSGDPIVHNLSSGSCSPELFSKENENPIEMDIKPIKKTQNIIRRIVVPSKKPPAN